MSVSSGTLGVAATGALQSRASVGRDHRGANLGGLLLLRATVDLEAPLIVEARREQVAGGLRPDVMRRIRLVIAPWHEKSPVRVAWGLRTQSGGGEVRSSPAPGDVPIMLPEGSDIFSPTL